MIPHFFLVLLGVPAIVDSGLVEVSLNPGFLQERGSYGPEIVGSTWKTILENSGIEVDVYLVEGSVVIGARSEGDLTSILQFLRSQDTWIENYRVNR
jgi:hypothetical protein